MTCVVRSVVALTVVAFAGCSGGESGSRGGAASASSGTVSYETDSRAMTYLANLTEQGKSGALQVVFVAADPAPSRSCPITGRARR